MDIPKPALCRLPPEILSDIVLLTTIPDIVTSFVSSAVPPARILATLNGLTLNGLTRTCRRLSVVSVPILYKLAAVLDSCTIDDAPPLEATELCLHTPPTTQTWPSATAASPSAPATSAASKSSLMPGIMLTPTATPSRGAFVIYAASAGNLSLVQRLMLHFPADSLLRRLLPP
ncbi:hypothetical protein ColTof4_14449 [Colletotrichum tofieldiae]|nr:hypothetical protein ColTof3_14829 [Colletotrichum tofieldiae]GKT82026.1 hypothetical protein ColTof4_14449 [Colletotrichum tofieldiae]